MRTLYIALILALFALVATPSFAARDVSGPEAGFVQKLGDRALTSLTAQNIPSKERAARVRALLNEYFDIRTIGRFVLGTHWREASEAQRQEYIKLFENMIVKTYTQRFAEYSGQSFKVLNAVKSGESDTIVASQILQKDGPAVGVEWRVRNKGGQMKIVDVLVEKISMSVTQRDDFDGVIQAGGGDVEALLNSLRKHQSGDSGTAKQASKH
jgi:phospholipid transport system substrate-binding protein